MPHPDRTTNQNDSCTKIALLESPPHQKIPESLAVGLEPGLDAPHVGLPGVELVLQHLRGPQLVAGPQLQLVPAAPYREGLLVELGLAAVRADSLVQVGSPPAVLVARRAVVRAVVRAAAAAAASVRGRRVRGCGCNGESAVFITINTRKNW